MPNAKDLDIKTQGLNWSIIGPPKAGKCLGFDTPVLKHSGEVVPVQNVRPGDQLMGPDSKPRNVLSTTKGVGPLFRITPRRGESWICNDAHILTVYDIDRRIVTDLPVRDVLAKRADKFMLVRKSVAFPAQPTELDPYFVGVWLGDGEFKRPYITNPEQEIREYLTTMPLPEGVAVKIDENSSECPRFALTQKKDGHHRANPLWTKLQACVLDEEKRIPRAYLVNSRQNRLQLLAGLIDTDGYLSRERAYEIITQYDGLKDDILFLARSLGFGVSARVKMANSGQWKEDRPYWRLSICGDISEIPCKVKRKASTHAYTRDVLRTRFTIEALPADEYYGFALDGDSRFLLGDFTVTHNSHLARTAAQYVLAKGKPVKAFFAPRAELVGYAGLDIEYEVLEDPEWDSANAKFITSMQDTYDRQLLAWEKATPAPGLLIIDTMNKGPSTGVLHRIIREEGNDNFQKLNNKFQPYVTYALRMESLMARLDLFRWRTGAHIIMLWHQAMKEYEAAGVSHVEQEKVQGQFKTFTHYRLAMLPDMIGKQAQESVLAHSDMAFYAEPVPSSNPYRCQLRVLADGVRQAGSRVPILGDLQKLPQGVPNDFAQLMQVIEKGASK